MDNPLYKYMLEEFSKNNLLEFSPLMGLLNLYGLDDGRARVVNKWNHYYFHQVGVPRVTNILDSINHKDLSGWIANLGRQYFSVRKTILDTGSLTHEMIEDYLMNNGQKAAYYSNYDNADQEQANNAYQNFIRCYNDIKSKDYKIDPICVENPIVTPFFGGTCDCMAHITDPKGDTKTYILDFKTSKKINFEYFIQVMFYTLGIKFINEVSGFNKFEPIDGIGIIRVNKEDIGYSYVLADFEHDPEFMQQLIQCVYSSLDWYYHQVSMQIYSFDYLKSFSL